ncbi:MAG: hypothetical protein Tp152SUR00d2C52646391_87 [Prokaryotic dsDNA virus sp.]|nr:MAG: hypothetical protein Tp152SUR00d2C52646391_87 [Prokaryotic dsDNA virus sp.]
MLSLALMNCSTQDIRSSVVAPEVTTPKIEIPLELLNECIVPSEYVYDPSLSLQDNKKNFEINFLKNTEYIAKCYILQRDSAAVLREISQNEQYYF